MSRIINTAQIMAHAYIHNCCWVDEQALQAGGTACAEGQKKKNMDCEQLFTTRNWVVHFKCLMINFIGLLLLWSFFFSFAFWFLLPFQLYSCEVSKIKSQIVRTSSILIFQSIHVLSISKDRKAKSWFSTSQNHKGHYELFFIFLWQMIFPL